MAAPPSPTSFLIQFSLISSQAASGGSSDSLSRSISPLMTIGYLRRQAWLCVQPLLPPAPDGVELDQKCLRLVCAGNVLSDDMKLLQELLKPPPATNCVFVVFKLPQTQPQRPPMSTAARASSATSASNDHSAAESEDATNGEFFCRICHGDGPAADFIQPCACSGSMRHVHAGCLTRWRSVATNAAARTQCEQCHYRYRITQEWWVQPLLAPSLIFACSCIGIVVAVCTLGVLLLPCAGYLISLLLLPPTVAHPLLISGCFGVGAVCFCHLVHMRVSWMFFRGGILHIDWHSLLLTLLPLLALQDMTIRVMIALGCLHAVAHGYALLKSSIMRYCSTHGERILSVGNPE